MKSTILALLLVPVVMEANNDEKMARTLSFKPFIKEIEIYAKLINQPKALNAKLNALKENDEAIGLFAIPYNLLDNPTAYAILKERINNELHPDTANRLCYNLNMALRAFKKADAPQITIVPTQRILNFVKAEYNFKKDLPESPKMYSVYSPQARRTLQVREKSGIGSSRPSVQDGLFMLELEEANVTVSP